MSRQLSDVLKEYFDRYGAQGKELEAEIKTLLAKGYKVDEAVRQAMINLDFDEQFINDIENVQIRAVGVGIGSDVSKLAGMKVFHEALNRPWSMDGIPLSKRLHGATQEMRTAIIDTISKQIKLNSTAIQTARALYDGYGYGNVTNQQDIAKYMKELAAYARRSMLPPGEDYELLKLLRQAQNRINNLAAGGAPNRALKASYQQIVDAINKNSEKALNNAIKVAIEEKSRYIAERIARTEGSRAWFDGFIAKNQDDEMVIAYKWCLASRHPVFDICDMYAKADMFGLGAGIYPKNKVPRLPAHPHCLCYLSEIYIGEVDLNKMQNRVNVAGQEWLNGLTDEQRKDVLGIAGAGEFLNSGNWQKTMRGWHGLYDPVSRLTGIDLSIPVDSLSGLKANMSKELEKLTESERRAITKYSGFSATEINRRIYGGLKLGRYEDQLHLLDSALSKGVIPNGISVYRKMLAKDFGIDSDNFKAIYGKIYMFKGLTSTSLNKESDIMGRDLIIKIDVPAGYKGGIYIKELVGYKHKYQEEVLFARGLTIQIKDIKLIENGYYIEAEVVKI